MRFFAAIALGACLLSCGGGSTPATIPQADACNQASKAICTRVFACPDPVLVAAQSLLLGGSEAMCEPIIQQNTCAAFQCTAGQTYHGDKAQQCKDQFSTVSCATLATAATGGVNAVLASVPACQQVCTDNTDASTSGG